MQNIIEAFLIIVIGVATLTVLGTLLWGFQYELTIPWTIFFQLATAFWFLGHLVPLTVPLDEQLLQALELDAGQSEMVLTLAPLGMLLVTIYLARSAGRRIAIHENPLTALITVIVTTAILSYGLFMVVESEYVQLSAVLAVLFPTLSVTITIGITLLIERPELRFLAWDSLPKIGLKRLHTFFGEDRSLFVSESFRATGASLVFGLGVSSLAIAILTFMNSMTIVALYESLHAGILGSAIITVAQFAVLPNAAIYGLAWFSGVGYQIGEGSAISPLGTDIGLVPNVPLIGITPPDFGTFAYTGFLIPIVGAFLAHYFIKNRDVSILEELTRAITIAFFVTVAVYVLFVAASGSAGPGRLAIVGVEAITASASYGILTLIGASLAAVSRYFLRINSSV